MLVFLFALVHAAVTIDTPVLHYLEQLWSLHIVTKYGWLFSHFPREALTSLLAAQGRWETTFEDIIGLSSQQPESYDMLLVSIASAVTSAVLTASIAAAAAPAEHQVQFQRLDGTSIAPTPIPHGSAASAVAVRVSQLAASQLRRAADQVVKDLVGSARLPQSASLSVCARGGGESSLPPSVGRLPLPRVGDPPLTFGRAPLCASLHASPGFPELETLDSALLGSQMPPGALPDMLSHALAIWLPALADRPACILLPTGAWPSAGSEAPPVSFTSLGWLVNAGVSTLWVLHVSDEHTVAVPAGALQLDPDDLIVKAQGMLTRSSLAEAGALATPPRTPCACHHRRSSRSQCMPPPPRLTMS